MTSENARRMSNISSNVSQSIPAAPPLPAPKPFQRAREAATRLFGYYSRPASPQNSAETERSLRTGRARFASLSTTQNATASHRTGLEINTLSINEKRTHALLGGKEIFKTVKVEDGRCAEDLNLRSAIRSNPTQASGQARQIYSIDIADVAWAKGDCGDYVAAATSSGKIILYDLGRAGVPAAQLHEHFRQVHRVTFNPHRGSLLLSGSHDGTVRLWDVRDVRHASTVQSKRKYSGQSDGVRDVKWSPTEGVDFAFGTDSGWIQRWDMRNLKTAKVRIPAHSELCSSIDWHPDGKHIASASVDKTVRIWDFSTTERQHKPAWQIKTPHQVSNARWRPPYESSISSGNSGRSCTQLVTAYDTDHSVLHVWDLRRPFIPFREIHPYSSAPTDLLWHSQDLLWTVGKEGVFLQTDVHYAPKTIDRRNLQTFAISSLNDLTFSTHTRTPRNISPPKRAFSTTASKSNSRNQSPERISFSRILVDDAVDHNFLTSVGGTRQTKWTPSTMRPPIAATSSLNESSFTKSLSLEDALQDQDTSQPEQAHYSGPLPMAERPEIFEFLAQNYCLHWSAASTDGDSFLESYANLFEHNAQCAIAVGYQRLGQTWRILGYWTETYLKKRAQVKQAQSHDDARQRPRTKDDAAPLARTNTKSAATAKDSDHVSEKPPAMEISHSYALQKEQGDASMQFGIMSRLNQMALGDDANTHTRSIYLPEDDDLDTEEGAVFTVVSMLNELVAYYAGKGQSQTAAHMLLLIGPLLPRNQSLPIVEITATVRAYTEYFTDASYTQQEIQSILSDNHESILCSGLQPLQIEAVLSNYNELLVRRRLFNEACILRKLSYPASPAVYESHDNDVSIGLRCGDCGKAISQSTGKLRCESCGVRRFSCAICWTDRSPYDGKASKIVSTCLICNHTAHTACIQAMIDDGIGGCVQEGCACRCFC